MANRVITLTPEAEARLNVLVAEYNAANSTTLNLVGWITLHLRELAIERDLLAEAARLRTQADADVVAAVHAERTRLLGTV